MEDECKKEDCKCGKNSSLKIDSVESENITPVNEFGDKINKLLKINIKVLLKPKLLKWNLNIGQKSSTKLILNNTINNHINPKINIMEIPLSYKINPFLNIQFKLQIRS